MNTLQFLKMSQSLAKAFPDSTIGKWVSHDDHEEMEVNTNQGMLKIRFFPKGDSK